MTSRSVLVGQDLRDRRVSIDLDTLLRTRLLIQANSGGGKSWLLRRLAEQLFGRIPVLIIDPEGEFATLREKYGYVLAAKGGDTPADVRSAEILAQRLLELRASAVCDLYEMKPGDRHEWVKRFLNALIDAPKKLWGPLIVIVDEAHLFCPEKGAGDSAAAEAMTALTTRGRKRGYCPIWATQRLAKLRKDAAAELQNVLIGSTFMDADRERAADALGVAKGDRKAFFDQIKLLPEGRFFGLGRAISLERLLIKVGPIETTHPDTGTKHAAAPPPPPEKVRALLPKLADLPAEAEAKERTLAEAKAEISRLKRDLVDAKRANPEPTAKVETKRVEISVVKPADLKRIEKLVEKLSALVVKLGGVGESVGEGVLTLSAEISAANQRPAPALATPSRAPVPIRRPPIPAAFPAARRASPSPAAAALPRENGDSPLGRMERAVLATLATYGPSDKRRLTLLSGYSWSGGFSNALGALRTAGLLEGPNTGTMSLTDAGAAAATSAPIPEDREARIQHWLNHSSFGPMERAVLELLAQHPGRGLTKEEILEATGYAWSGGFSNALGKLRTAGVIEGKNTGKMFAVEDLFT